MPRLFNTIPLTIDLPKSAPPFGSIAKLNFLYKNT
ncbi:hypothetical protein CHELA20_11007 [Hyphomicrobiales bacterium]|nr:hypothetical protein CHELA20_11007 [Hyphomicrobiales bacterium]CAH1694598.1 hypothetical protein CHELA41_51238 [Hyphomicrobiales bacterium]